MRHIYQIRPRKDHRGVDLMSAELPVTAANATTNAVDYAKFYSRSQDAVSQHRTPCCRCQLCCPERLKTVGGVVVASHVDKECINSNAGVQVARGVAMERKITDGRVEAAYCVVKKRPKADGHVAVAVGTAQKRHWRCYGRRRC